MCTFKGTRFLDTNGHGDVMHIYSCYKYTTPAPEVEFHSNWKPVEPGYNHIKILKVGPLWYATHHLLTLWQVAVKSSLLPLILAKIEHQKKVGDEKKQLIAVDRNMGVRDYCGVLYLSFVSVSLMRSQIHARRRCSGRCGSARSAARSSATVATTI
jgi:hypothetical protein